jgi:hypothetical protein
MKGEGQRAGECSLVLGGRKRDRPSFRPRGRCRWTPEALSMSSNDNPWLEDNQEAESELPVLVFL